MRQLNNFISLRIGIFSLLFLFQGFSYGQKESVTISGLAPDYVGKEIIFNQIEDYYSQLESKFASTTVKADSTFSVKFYLDKTQKIAIHGKNNYGWMYIEPGAKYEIFVPGKNPRDPDLRTGNNIEMSFYGLEPTDINYKILSFQRWSDDFIAKNYSLKFNDPILFTQKLDTFKTYVERAYKMDSSIFFLTHVKFSMAGLDDINTSVTRGRDEKFDFYVDPSPVFYKNDAYMSYIKKFYKNTIPRLSNETNNAVYLAVLKSSPTLVMKALGHDYTLRNLRIREMVMIQSLSEAYYGDDFPQTNINTIFDSLKRRCLFKENQEIASNIFQRLHELVPGGRSPDFVLFGSEKTTKTHMDYRGKHLYITFYDPKSPNNQKEMVLLKEMHRKYINDVNFLTIIRKGEELIPSEQKNVDEIQWDKFSLAATDDFIKQFKITNFPSYILIDPEGYIVQSPALGPTPNAQYQTIDKTFYYIQQKRHKMMEER